MGGDDVSLNCWESYINNSTSSQQFWEEKEIPFDSISETSKYFFEQSFQFIFKHQKHAIIWYKFSFFKL